VRGGEKEKKRGKGGGVIMFHGGWGGGERGKIGNRQTKRGQRVGLLEKRKKKHKGGRP